MINDLNKLLLEETKDEDISEYTFIQSLVDIILSINKPIMPREYHHKMRLNQATKYSLAFLESLQPKYAEALSYALHNGKITYYAAKQYPDMLSHVHMINGDKHIELVCSDTIEDSYTLTHEIMHFINFDTQGQSVNWHLMTEAFSILAEALQKRWFAKFKIKKCDYLNNEINTLYALKVKAIRLDFEIKLMIAFLERGYIDESIYLGLLEGKNRFYIDEVLDDLISSIEKKEFNFHLLQRDIIGGCLSSYMLERIDSNPKYLSEFIELNDYCQEMYFSDTLRYLGLDLADEDLMVLEQGSLEKIKSAYVKRVKNMHY